MTWRVRYSTAGGHIHCRLFAAKQSNMTFAKCGDFTVRVEEFESFKQAFAGAEFVDDDREKNSEITAG